VSKLSTIVAALRAGIPLLSRYASKYELSNSVNVERNSDHMLEAGWGVKIDPSSNGTIGILNFLNEAREFSIITTRKSVHKKSDAAAFMADQIDLMEDHSQLIKWLVGEGQIGIPDTVAKVDFVSKSGIELVAEKEKFIQTTTTISIDILEQVGCL
jgi:hypothetical protein